MIKLVKYVNRSLFIVLVCSLNLNAQSKLENIQVKNWLPDTISFFDEFKNIKKQFKKQRFVELSQILSQKLTQNRKCVFHLKLDSLHDWNIELEPYSVLASNYARKTNDSVNLVNLGDRVQTFKGFVNGNLNNVVRISLIGNVITGLIIENDHQFYLEPIKNFFKNINSSNAYILYEASDVVIDSGTCAMTDVHDTQDKNLYRKSNDEIQAEGCVEVDIAIAADYGFVQSRGGVAAAEQRIISILNLVNGIYSAKPLEIEYKISATYFSTASENDPWNSTNNASDLLSSFQTWGNNGGFGKTFDIASLWTSRNLEANGSNGIVGIAYVGAVCNNLRYNVMEHYSTNINAVMINQSHELGHNWNCQHANGSNFIMNPTIGTSNIDWDQTSINSIVAWKRNARCLANCGPKAPIAEFSY
ncbi:MAG: hypothetical protein EAZ07_01455 [Cytophagales bacterium]|nr:MAG: hypothetical protein EAZ07_01455 [Cytophagales bacterium]